LALLTRIVLIDPRKNFQRLQLGMFFFNFFNNFKQLFLQKGKFS